MAVKAYFRRLKLVPRIILILFACVLLAGVILAGDVIRGAPTSTIGTSGDEDIGGVSEIDSEISERSEVWEHGGDQLSSIAERYRELLNIQSEVKSHVIIAKPSFAQGEISERLLAGIPLLSFEDFSLDWAQVRTVFEQIAVWAAKDSQASGEVESLKNIARNSSLLKEVVSTWYKGDAVGAALKPFLRAYSELLLPEVNQELWRHRYCPITICQKEKNCLDITKTGLIISGP